MSNPPRHPDADAAYKRLLEQFCTLIYRRNKALKEPVTGVLRKKGHFLQAEID